MTKVSIIIPYIDEHDYLAEAIAAAVGQETIEKEIIVVCNALSFAKDDLPIPTSFQNISFLHEPQSGSAYARNLGLKHASGEWIQFLDVDDLLLENKVFHQLVKTDADVIVSPHVYQYVDGSKENSKWLCEDVWIGLLNSGLGSTSSMLWNRQALIEVGGWSTSYQSHQEYELLFRLIAAGKKIVPYLNFETIVRQRKSGSITMTSKPVRIEEGIELRERMWKHLLLDGKTTPARFDAFRQYIFKQLRGLYRQDPSDALKLYTKYYSEAPFTPKDIHVPGYAILYKLFGFKKTELIIRFFISLKK